ncbi:MAG: cytochrome c oxidase assembly factor Coa1 family protein [Candidatus Acidiferrales bacterium]
MNSPSNFPTAYSPQSPNTWFRRNWRWFIPTVIGGLILCAMMFAFVVLWLVSSMFRSSYPYQFAVQRARESSEVAERVGSPLHVGWFISGQINLSGPGGNASLSIPITGARGHGDIIVEAKKSANRWTFETLEVDVAGRAEPIPLPGPTPNPDPRFFPGGQKP